METKTRKPSRGQILLNFWFIICLITNTVHVIAQITTKNIIHELILLFVVYVGFGIAKSVENKQTKEKENPIMTAKEKESESDSEGILVLIFWVCGIIYLWNIW